MLELLVSLALLALLTIVLLAGFRLATGQLDRQASRLERSTKLAVVYGFLRSHLADARLIEPVNSESDTVVFDGRRSRITFVGAAPEGAARGGLYLYSIETASGQLRARWRLFEGFLPAVDDDAEDTVLLDGVRRVDIAYYGALRGDADVAWQDEWLDAPYLPLLVRLGLVLEDGDPAPTLVVAPRLRPLRAIPTAPPVAVPRR